MSDKSTKDKAMSARLKGTAQSGTMTASNGIEKFQVYKDAEFRTVTQCAICHKAIGLLSYDSHLRTHMANS